MIDVANDDVSSEVLDEGRQKSVEKMQPPRSELSGRERVPDACGREIVFALHSEARPRWGRRRFSVVFYHLVILSYLCAGGSNSLFVKRRYTFSRYGCSTVAHRWAVCTSTMANEDEFTIVLRRCQVSTFDTLVISHSSASALLCF